MSLFTSDSSLMTRLRLSLPASLSLFLSPSLPFLLVSRPPLRDLELDRLIFLFSALTDSLKSSLASPLVRGAVLLLPDLNQLVSEVLLMSILWFTCAALSTRCHHWNHWKD